MSTTDHKTFQRLCGAIRALPVDELSTPELVARVTEAVGQFELEDLAAALQQVGQEKIAEADEITRYVRRRSAGIRGVIDGGK